MTTKTDKPTTAFLYEALRNPHLHTRSPKGQAARDHRANCAKLMPGCDSIPAPLVNEFNKLRDRLDCATLDEAFGKALRQIGPNRPITTATMFAEQVIRFLSSKVIADKLHPAEIAGEQMANDFIANYVEPKPETPKLKTDAEIDAEFAANPLLHFVYATGRLQDAARDVIQYSDDDGALMAELAAALKEVDGNPLAKPATAGAA
jgi:hypothetical protein